MVSLKGIPSTSPILTFISKASSLGNYDKNCKLWNTYLLEDIYFNTLAVGMSLHTNGNFTIRNLKSSLFSFCFVLDRLLLSISRR